MGKMDFSKSAAELERLIRGLNPWPSAYTWLEGRLLKIWEAEVVPGEAGEEPGKIIQVGKDFFTVQTGEAALQIRSLQLEGKKRMDTGAFLRGYEVKKGQKLGRKE